MTIDLRAGIDGAVDSGVVTRWLCRVGDHVGRDEVLAEIETDKANVELRAPEDGVVVALFVAIGASFPRDAALLRFEPRSLGHARSSLEGRALEVVPLVPEVRRAEAPFAEPRCVFCGALLVGGRIDCARCGAPR